MVFFQIESAVYQTWLKFYHSFEKKNLNSLGMFYADKMEYDLPPCLNVSSLWRLGINGL